MPSLHYAKLSRAHQLQAFDAAGIHFMEAAQDMPGMPKIMDFKNKGELAMAMDALLSTQPQLVTTSSAAIPWYFANYIDPAVIEVLFAPNKAADIVGDERRMGDWVTETATFLFVEKTGEVSSYGDYSMNGVSGLNANFPQRQSYTYQTFSQWGEREAERAGLAKISWASEVNQASIYILNKFQNNSYFFGIQGLQNYGLINDPSLSPSLTPGNKAFNSNSPGPWITNGVTTATVNEIYNDIVTMYTELLNQSDGLINDETPMTLAMSPYSSAALQATNAPYNTVNLQDMLKKNFPNMRVDTAVQYGPASTGYYNSTTSTGYLVQLIATNVEGQKTAQCAFTEKLRAHPIIRLPSAWLQKKSQGTWGTVIYRPFAISSMLGV